MTAAECLRSGVDVRFIALQVPKRAVEVARKMLSTEELTRASRCYHAEDRRRFIVSHAALRSALSDRTGIDREAIELRRGPHGKPELSGAHGVAFSMSRAGELAALALAARPVGIDIVAMSSDARLLDAAPEYCSPRELRSISRLTRRLQIEALACIWARKEALLKATGEGLTRCPADFSVWEESGWGTRGSIVPIGGSTWIVQDIVAPHGYRAALAHRAA